MEAVPQEELDRLEALARCRIVGTPPEPEFDVLARQAALLTSSSNAVFCLVDAERLWVKAAHGCDPGDYPRACSPCELAIREGGGMFELSELEPRLSAHPLLAGASSYAAVPLRDAGHAVGTLAVFAEAPRVLSEAQREQLTSLALVGSRLLELHRLRYRRRQNDALVHSVTRVSGIGCWEWDLLTGETTLTDEMFTMFGVPASARLGWDAYVQLIHPEDREEVIARIMLATRGETPHFPDYRIIRPDGQVRIVHPTSELERDANGRPVRLTGALHDVTAQRAAEEQRKQVAVKAVQTQKLESLGVLSGGVAHDFNNLLVGVLGNAELALADRALTRNTRDLLERIVDAGHRASALTRQLLAYTGRSHLRFIEVDLAAQVEKLVARLRTTLPLSVALRAELASDLPAVRADLDQLQLLTSNLVVNAAESYQDGGEVTLRVFALDLQAEPAHDVSMPTRLTHGRYVVLEVVDDGCGMEPTTLERALDPFFTTKFTGRGLGLSAVLGIARSHAGVLTVDSKPGRGSRVRLYFPALDCPATPRVQSDPPLERSVELQGHTVLLVDDEQLVRNVERMAMQRLGLRVLEAAEGAQAITVLAQHRDQVDLVLLDLVMPGLDAATTLRELRALRPDLPVIVQSGYSEEDAARSLEKLDGRLDFLQKPFSVQALISKVTSVLRRE